MSPDLQMSSSGLNKMIGYQNGCFCNGYQVTYPIAGVGYTFLIRFVHLSFLRKLLSHGSCISCTLNEKKDIFILKNIFLVCWVIFLHLLTMEGFEILTLVMAYFLFWQVQLVRFITSSNITSTLYYCVYGYNSRSRTYRHFVSLRGVACEQPVFLYDCISVRGHVLLLPRVEIMTESIASLYLINCTTHS